MLNKSYCKDFVYEGPLANICREFVAEKRAVGVCFNSEARLLS